MTKHNIKEHLSWLINSGSSHPPRPAHAPPSAVFTSDLGPFLDNLTPPRSFEEIGLGRTEALRTAKDVGDLLPEPQFARPSLPASKLNAQRNDPMARLQSGAKQSHKPRLLSEGIPLSLQTPTTTSSGAPRTTLKDRYTAQWEPRAPVSAPPAQRDERTFRQYDTPAASRCRSQHTYEDAAAVGLGGDGVHASSSSTVEAFGESRPIWREDSATRKEPLDAKGRKRKSDEFEEDELQMDLLSRLSQNSFTAIDEFEDDPAPQKIEGSPVKSDSQQKTERLSISQKTSLRQSANDHLFDDDLGSPSTLGKISGQQVSRSPIGLRAPGVGQAAKRASVKRGKEAKNAAPNMSNRKTVADSEDEDEEAGYLARHWPLKQEPDKRKSPPTATVVPTAKDRLQSPKKEERLGEIEGATRVSLPPAKAPQNLQAGSGASPYQRDSPTKFPIDQQPMHSPQLFTSLDSSNHRHELADKEFVQAFLTFQTSRIQAFLDGLHRSRRSVAEAVYSRTIEGKAKLPDLDQQAESLTARINAIDALLLLREEYIDLVKRKEVIKDRMLAALQNDLLDSHYAKDQAEQMKIMDRLAQIELDISKHLMEASLPPSNNLPLESSFKSYPTAVNAPSDCPTTLVQSTQAYPYVKSRVMPDGRLPVPSSSNTTQFVQQTQADSHLPHTPGKAFKGQDSHKQRTLLKTYTSSPAARDVNAYFSPSKASKVKESGLKLQGRKSHEPKHCSNDSEKRRENPKLEHIEEDEDLFASHRASPYQPRHDDDEYGRDYDDVDMLEVAEELENRNIQPSICQDNVQRKVFAETSGNVIRHEGTTSVSAPVVAPAFTHAHYQPSQMQHPWSRDVKSALKDRFHLRGFRPNQLEAINATLAGKDAFVLMPTGGGKSLCYQLPSIVNSGKTQGVTVVISPLLSLMQDQVEHLQKLKIQALLVNGEVTTEHRRLVLGCLKDPQPQRFCQLLYITPEMINKSQAMINALQDLYKRRKLARIVIDEAHCVSQWGHDFRPDYKQLGEVRQQFRGVPVIALTATATENVKVDVIYNLGIQNCEVFTQSFNRPNLSYEVRTKGKAKDVLDNLASTIKTTYRGQSGIIYCLSKKNCEDIAGKLHKQYNIAAHHYHAGMEPEEKKHVQKEWQAGRYHVIVATIAFGMGIDKPDVRFVIHHTIPKSLEGYYQETGRAGRDGKRSGCFMYYGYQDTSMIKRMIDDGEGSWDQKERQRQMLRKVIQFCENKSDCRRVQVLGYFNEAFNKEDCRGSCDNCNSSSTFETQDFTNYATSALDLVRKIQTSNVTLLHCVDVFRGAKTKKITDFCHDDLQEFGAGSSIDKGNVERLFYRLLSEDAIEEKNVVNKLGFANQYVHLGKNSYDFSKGRRKLKIQIRLSPTGKPKAKSTKKKTATGIAASRPEFPASTNVSSPVQAASRRRIKRSSQPAALPYVQENDGFIVGDGEEYAVNETEDDSEEYFEPVRVKGKTRSLATKPLGPPITIDEKIERLNPIHQIVVEDFLNTAKQQSQKLLLSKSLRAHPFTDTMLREMAINFPESEDEMLEIPGIDPDKVERYGKIFLKLIRDAHRGYEAMMQQQEDRPQDPNHQNVIDISSDDEYGKSDGLVEIDADEESLGEPSRYFPSHDVSAFNAQLTQLPPPAPSAHAKSQNYDSKRPSGVQGGRSGYHGPGGITKGGRKASGGVNKGKAPAGSRKKQSTGSITSGGSFGPGRPKKGRPGGDFGGRGIGMMPT